MAKQIGLQATLDIDAFLRGAGQYQSAIDDMNGKTASFAGAAVGHFQDFGGAALRASAVVATASAAVIAAIGAWVGKGILNAADLEEKISGIVSILDGDTVKAFGGAEKAAAAFDSEITDLGLDPNLKVTATEAADAINQLVSAGVPAQAVLDGAAHSTVLLANATGADLTMAANIAAHSMSIFGIKTGDLEDAVSNIAGVVGKSTFTISDYSMALAAGGGVAASVGVSFEDFNATIAATSPLFSSGSDAGTSFKTFLQRLTPQTDKAATEMKRLGLNFYNADGSMKSMTEVSGLLQKAFSGLTEEQKNQSASIIFGTDAMRTAFALASTGAEEFDKLKNSIDSVDANQQAIIRVTNLKGAFEILQGQIDAVQSAIGKKFLPVLRELTQWASEWVSQYGHQLIDFFGQVATAVDAFRNALTAGVSPMSAFFIAMSGFGETGIYVATIIQNIVEKTQSFVMAATAILSPIISAIASFVSWKDVLITVGLAIASVVIPAIYGFIAALLPVIATVGAVLLAVAALRNAWESNFLGIQTGTIAAITYITGALAPFTSSVAEHFGGALTEIKNFALGNQTEFTNVAAIWEGAKTSATTLFTDLSSLVTTYLPVWTAKLTEWSVAASQWITDAIPIVTQKLTEWYTALATYIVTNYPTWLAAMALWGNAVWQWIVDATALVVAQLGAWYTELSTYVSGQLPTWQAELAYWATATWQWIVDATGLIGAKLGEWYTRLSNYIAGQLPTWKASFVKWAEATWQWIVDATTEAKSKITIWAISILSYIAENLPDLLIAMIKWAEALVSWIVKASADIVPKLGLYIGYILGWILGQTLTIASYLLLWASAFLSWIADVIVKIAPELGKLGAAIIAGIISIGADILKAFGNMALGWAYALVTTVNWTQVGMNLALALWNGLRYVIVFTAAIFKTAIDGILSLLGIAGNAASTVFTTVGKSILDGVVAGIGALVEGKSPVVAKFDEIITAAKKVWTDSVASFKQLGTDIIDGITAGLEAAKDALKQKMLDIANALPSWVKKALGIESPSKVFMAIGRYVIQGFVAGLKDEWAIRQGEFKDLFLFAMPKGNIGGSGYWDLPTGLAKTKDVASGLLSVFKKLADMSPSANHSGMSAAVQSINDSLTVQLDLLDQIEKAGLDPRGVLGDTWMGIGADPGKLADSIFEVTKLAQQKLNNEVINRRNSLISKFVLQPFTDALTNQAQVIADTLKNVATDFGKIRIDRLLAQIADVDKQIATYTQISDRQGLTFDEQNRFRDLVNQRGTLAAQIGATSNIEGFFNISDEATRLDQMKKQVDLLKQARDLSADIPADAFGNIANDSTLRALVEVYAHVQNAQLNQLQSQLSTLQSNNIQAQLNQYKAQQASLDSQIALLQKARDLGLQLSGESTWGANTPQSDINNLTLRIAQEQLRRTQNELKLIQGIPANLLNLSPTNSVAQLYKTQVLDPMLKTLREAVLLDSQRADLMAKYVAGAEKVQTLNDKQSQLDYLKFQTDLIKQVNDTFSAAGAQTVLADTHFGLDASLDDLLAFATRMVNGMVDKVKNGLGIASPSKVFIDIGQRVMQGFSRGMESMADKPIMAINQALRPLPYAYAGGQRTMNVNMGGVSISNGMDDVMFEHRVRQVVEGMMA